MATRESGVESSQAAATVGKRKRASQCLDQAESGEPTLETMQKLSQLHSHADPPDVDMSDTAPVRITSEIISKALQRLQEVQVVDQPRHTNMSRLHVLVEPVCSNPRNNSLWPATSFVSPIY